MVIFIGPTCPSWKVMDSMLFLDKGDVVVLHPQAYDRLLPDSKRELVNHTRLIEVDVVFSDVAIPAGSYGDTRAL